MTTTMHDISAPDGPAPAPDAPPAPERPEDARLAGAIRGELVADPVVDASRIEISARNGIVELRGEVPHLGMAEAAVARAEMVDGVRAVIRAIEIAPTLYPDATVRSMVEAALVDEPVLRLRALDVRAADGVVTLRGQARSHAERRLAERVAGSVAGVRDVVSELSLPTVERSDEEIARDVTQALRADRWIDEWLLEVDVSEGVVSLRGVQPTAAARRRAIEAAWIAGARAVRTTELGVDPELSPEQRRLPAEYVYPDDEEILASVARALARHPRLTHGHVSVEVSDGVVSLAGTVRSLAARAAAEEAAESVRGVFEVENRLRIGTPRLREDVEAQVEAERALARSAAVDEDHIEVRVERGVLTLTGSVESPYERFAATDAVQGIQGVREVRNEINVPLDQVAEPIRDDVLAQNVITHLEAHPYVDPAQIQVLASGGRVILRGEVDDWRARREAVRAAYEAGAVEVLDDIEVREGPAQ